MLVLSRKKNERIVIDGNITIVIVEIRGDKVRIGVEAPPMSQCIARRCSTLLRGTRPGERQTHSRALLISE